jgi:hypothetical protein
MSCHDAPHGLNSIHMSSNTASAGVTAVMTTLPTPTETETDEEPACRDASMVKRAGEGLGYQFQDDWDVIRMPGWRYF